MARRLHVMWRGFECESKTHPSQEQNTFEFTPPVGTGCGGMRLSALPRAARPFPNSTSYPAILYGDSHARSAAAHRRQKMDLAVLRDRLLKTRPGDLRIHGHGDSRT